ncbi:MAG TPA: GNAT family N-acetyltransferase [Polyangiaceae bacterium]|jgi:amino-acid N-acetyltransferase
MTNPPQKVRVAKLTETQIDAVVTLDLAAKQSMHRAGVPASEVPARGLAGIAKLTKLHDVLAADADGAVAGYAAWRDESPGVAYLEDLAVKPELQRVGVATKLLDSVKEKARAAGLPVLLVRCWSKAAPAKAFLEKSGFVALGSEPEAVGDRVAAWREEQEAHGGLVREGQVVLVHALQ